MPLVTSTAAHWELSFPNRLSHLMKAIDQMLVFLERFPSDPDCFYAARLVAEEIGTNTIKYGYDDQSTHTITLRADCLEDSFLLTLEDDGRPFDPVKAPEANPCLKLEDRRPGGWGICLVRRLTQRIDYERQGARNLLRLWISRRSSFGLV
jgi:anti-sigma regulatory factor (Ser/Thr protein kinase)